MNHDEIKEKFREQGGYFTPKKYPVIPEYPAETEEAKVSFLTGPGVACLSKPNFDIEAIKPFLAGFHKDLGFSDYLKDPVEIQEGAAHSKFAGQLCYLSLGERRTMNDDADRYFDNIKAQAHGSVLEHCYFSFLLWGISRSLTHELVRHRAGTAFSQVSQRYVGGKTLRFVERPEFQNSRGLDHLFQKRCELNAHTYETIGDMVSSDLPEDGLSKVERRKAVQQVARAALPNETEAPMVFTANIRALRHIFEMRVSRHAEPEIRKMAYRMFLCAAVAEPIFFSDYEVTGEYELFTHFRKV